MNIEGSLEPSIFISIRCWTKCGVAGLQIVFADGLRGYVFLF